MNILGINDFHGRIKTDGVAAGAAVMDRCGQAGERRHANTVFAAAGDLVGGSTFESFIAHDKPTIDALNAAGLEVSSVGNHEFDKGYNDLVDRVMAPASASNPEGGAGWRYLAANVRLKDSGHQALDPTFVQDMDEVSVGFVGAVTEDLPSLVSPGGSPTSRSPTSRRPNAAAAALKADGADMVVLLVHEGAVDDISTLDDDAPPSPGSSPGSATVTRSSPVTRTSPTTAAGTTVVPSSPPGSTAPTSTSWCSPSTRYRRRGAQVELIVAAATLPLTAPAATAKKAEVKAIVDDAVSKAAVLGARVIGKVGGSFNRGPIDGGRQTGSEENRGGESTLGNLVAEVQRWATSTPETGAAQIAFMNPGGLRADILGNTPRATRRTSPTSRPPSSSRSPTPW